MKGLYKGTFRKLLAAMAALGLTLTGIVPAYAGNGSANAVSETEAATEADTLTAAPDETEAEETGTETEKETEKPASAEKEETVYIFTDANGNQKSMVVSDWLKNLDKSTSIDDISGLTGIENVKGDETFTQDGEKLTWAADGNDIYYQGTTDKESPISVQITYYLDGKEIAPKDLAGKSGHVKIHYEYINSAEKEETIDGKKIKVKVPFGVMSGMLMSNGTAKNVTVSSGKVIQQGDTTAVVGLAFPGLRDSLNLKNDKDLDIDVDDSRIPESLDVEADVTDFSLDMNMTVVLDDALNSVFDEFDEKSETNKIEDKIDDLKDASEKLVDGTSDLYDGTKDLKDGTKKLKDGTDDLKDGTSQLKDGADDLKKGIGDYTDGVSQVYDGTKKLKNGTSDLKKGADQLATGTGDLKDGAVDLRNGTTQLKNGAKQVKDGASSLDDGAAKLESGAGDLKKGAGDLDSGAADLKNGTSDLRKGAAQLDRKAGELAKGVAALKGGADKAEAGAKTLSTGAKSLIAGIDTFTNTAKSQLDDGEDKLQNGANQLKAGSVALLSGISTLASKIGELHTRLDGAGKQIEEKLAPYQDVTDQSIQQIKEIDGQFDSNQKLLAASTLDDYAVAAGNTQLAGLIQKARQELVGNDVKPTSVKPQQTAPLKTVDNQATASADESAEIAEKPAAEVPAASQVPAVPETTPEATAAETESAKTDTSAADQAAQDAAASAAAISDTVTAADTSAASAKDKAAAGSQSAQSAASAYDSSYSKYADKLDGLKNVIAFTKFAGTSGTIDSAVSEANGIKGQYDSAYNSYSEAGTDYDSAIASYQDAIKAYQDSIAAYQDVIEQYQKLLEEADKASETETAVTEAQQPAVSTPETTVSTENKQETEAKAVAEIKFETSAVDVEIADLADTSYAEAPVQTGSSITDEQLIKQVLTDMKTAGASDEQIKATQEGLTTLAKTKGTLNYVKQNQAKIKPGTEPTVNNSDYADYAKTLWDAKMQQVDTLVSMRKLQSGLGEAVTGTGQLQWQFTNEDEPNDPTKASFKRGMMNLDDGIDQLQSQVPGFKTGIDTAFGPDGIGQVKVGAQTLSAGIDDPKKGLVSGLTELAKGAGDASDGAARLQSEGTAKVLDGSKGLDDGAAKLKNGTSQLVDGANKLYKGTDDLHNGSSKLSKGAKDLYDGTADLQKGARQLVAGTVTLDNGAEKLADGAKQLDDGVADAKKGVKKLVDNNKKLNDGASDLYDGAKKLDDGAGDLKDGVSDLDDGASDLKDGAKDLKDGMKKFNDEAIQKVVDLFDGDIKDLADRMKALKNAAEGYDTFTGLGDDMNGSVKFIIRSDSITTDDAGSEADAEEPSTES